MTVPQMRAAIHDAYPGAAWHRKVNNMPDDQVIAVYHSFLAKGKFDKKSAPVEKTSSEEPRFKPFIGVQLKMDV